MAGTPTLVQHYSSGRDNSPLGGGGSQTNPSLKLTLPNASLSGNCLVLEVEFANPPLTVGTVTDNKGNTWAVGPTVNSSSFSVATFYVLNATAGTQTITIPFTGTATTAQSSLLAGAVSEFYNCQLSGAIGPTGTAGSVAGTATQVTLSGTPTLGDLVLLYGADVTTATPTLTSITKGTGFTLLSAQMRDGRVAEYSITTTSTTPGFTPAPTSDNFSLVALTIKAGTGGTVPGNKIRIVHEMTEMYDAATHTAQFPCVGNLLVGLLTSPDITITAITDDGGANDWKLGVLAHPPAQAGTAQIFYAASASVSTDRTISVTFSGTSTGLNNIHFYDVANASKHPFDVFDARNGNQTTNGNLTSGVLAPTTYNGMVMNVTVIEWHTIGGMVADANGHTPILDQAVNTKNDSAQSGTTSTPPSTLDQDDGRAHLYNTDLLPITFIYSNTGNGTNPPTGVLTWASTTVAFKDISNDDQITVLGNWGFS